jgi:hypothetical protein
MLTPAAIREITNSNHEAQAILNQRSVSRADGKSADLLLSKSRAFVQAGYSTDERATVTRQSAWSGNGPRARAV